MKHSQPGFLQTRPQTGFYAFNSFFGGLIRNTSLLMLIFLFAFAALAAAVDTAKSFWYHPGVRRFVVALEADVADKVSGVQNFVAALESDLADTASSDDDLKTEPTAYIKDPAKVQREENRARRKLAKELRLRKASTRKY